MRKQFVQLTNAEKLRLLKKHALGTVWKSLKDKNWCLHCQKQFSGHSVRVYQDDGPGLWLECGPLGCDGSPVDWADHPWWDENHPLTQAHDKAVAEAEEEERGKM